jgi:hypothetical protein
MSDNTDTPISPEDEPTEAEIAEARAMRPIEDLPSNFTVKGNPQMLAELPPLTAFSQEDRQAIRQAAGSDAPEAIQGAILDFLQERRTEFRIKAGPGEGASGPEREALEQLNQLRLWSEEYHRLEAELARPIDHRTEYDERGEPVAVPIYLQGSLRTSREVRMGELRQSMSLLAGIEGEAAMQRAVRSEALNRRKVKAQIEERQEIIRRAHEKAREKRINEAADAKAKFL